MKGDSVDNIPGLPGVGDKTAKKFISEFGSLEGLFENTDQLKGKIKEKVEQNKELGILSKKLATIITDVPLSFKIEDFKLVFLIGFPRSGTTLLDTILRSHREIQVIEEKPMISVIEKLIKENLKTKLENIFDLSENDLLFLKQQYFELLKKNSIEVVKQNTKITNYINQRKHNLQIRKLKQKN